MNADTDREDKRPASRRVADELVARIEADEFSPGDSLPTYRSLADDYGVAVNTALAAVRLLRDEGMVTIKPNAGAEVRDRSKNVDVAAELKSAGAELENLRAEAQRFDTQLANLEARIAALTEHVVKVVE